MIGSPLVVWNRAQQQAERMEATPVPKKRVRELSVDSTEDARRRRLDITRMYYQVLRAPFALVITIDI